MNQARKLVEDFNNYLQDDPRFASYIRTPFFYLMDSNLAKASRFQYCHVAPHPLTPLGFLNGFFKDDVLICYYADDEVRSYAFKLMRMVDGGFIPVGDEEPIKCVTYAEYDKDWNDHVAADPSFVRKVNRWVYEGTTYDLSLSSAMRLLIETEARKPTPMARWMQDQFDNAEKTVATWSPTKRRAAGMGEPIADAREEMAKGEAVEFPTMTAPPHPNVAAFIDMLQSWSDEDAEGLAGPDELMDALGLLRANRTKPDPRTVIALADALRVAQRNYLADRGNEEKGRLVGKAAEAYDLASREFWANLSKDGTGESPAFSKYNGLDKLGDEL